jgi:outer membrane protein assembly factor BamB
MEVNEQPRTRHTGPNRAMGLAMLAAVLLTTLRAGSAWAQDPAAPVRPLRSSPVEKFTVNAGVRDWGPSTLSGVLLLAGGPTGNAGLFAVDTASGTLKWRFSPARISGSVSTPPAVAGGLVLAPFGAANPGAVVAVSLASGKEVWRGPDPAAAAAVVTHDGLAYVLAKDGLLHALDAATGRPVWQLAFARKSTSCISWPVQRDGVLYLTATLDPLPGDPASRASSHLFAVDARTGQERWRYPTAPTREAPAGVCLNQPLLSGDTVYGIGDNSLHAVDRASGQPRFAPVPVRRVVEGRERGIDVRGLVDAGDVLVGVNKHYLIAFDKASGRTAWDVPGQYNMSSPATAVAGRVLYVQGHPGAAQAPDIGGRILYVDGKPVESAPVLPGGVLRALDLDTRSVLWTFSRRTAEANWPFGSVTPVDGGLWVDSYQAMVKLQ